MGADAVEIVFSFADEDQEYYHKISEQLGPWRHEGQLCCWSRLDVQAGQSIEEQVEQHLKAAPLIVLLLSPEYLNSDHLYDVEAAIALSRQKAGQAQIVPILARPCNYQATEFGKLKILPTNTRPISSWERRDQAFSEVAEGIGKLLEHIPATTSLKKHNQFWTVPYPRNPYFTGREAELRAIHDALSAGQNAAIVQAISGLGGVGKTQLALEYAYRHREDYRYVFWVLADTRDTLNAEYSKIAELLDLPGKSQPEQRYIVAAVKNWLEKNTDWLLILDNADNLELFTSLTSDQEAFGGYLPTSAPGRILLTTRSHALGRLTRGIEIRELAEEDGSSFLLRRARIIGGNDSLDKATPGDRETAQKIVRELDGLPLALDQAGAYIEETSCGLQGYLTRYQKQRKELLKMRGGLVNDHPQSVATTWQLAFERVEKADPAAADLLRLCAFLAPDDIPEMIITEGEAELTGPLKKLARNPLKLDKAIAELQKYSLVSRDPNTQTLSLHRLVQAVIRDAMIKNVERAWAVRTVRIMERVFPWPEEIATWETCKQLLPHAQACAELIEQWQMEMVEAANLLHNEGKYLFERAEYREAHSYFEKAVEIKRKILGNGHPNTAASLMGLANVYRAQGNYKQALALHQQALATQRKVLGDEHPDTATSLNNLALAYHNRGNYEQALALHQQAFDLYRKVLGEEHSDTARSLSNLALIYEKQGKYEGAEVLCKQALKILRKVLGEAHPDTAYSLNNLGELYQAQGKNEEAETLFQQALAIRLKALGEAHPLTAESMYNLAMLYKSQRRYEEALPLFEKALAIRREKLVPEHAETKKTWENYEETLRKLEEERDG